MAFASVLQKKPKPQPGTLPVAAGGATPTDLVNQPGQTTDPAPAPEPAPATLPPPPVETNPNPSQPTAGAEYPTATLPTAAPVAPSGGRLTDPAYAAQLVNYWGTQPGANPSVAGDPNYWIGKLTSGAFGNDEQYAISRFLTPEGAPAGASQGIESLIPQMAQQTGATAVQSASQPSAPITSDPFALIGGGVQTPGGGWVPIGHPDAANAIPSAPTAAVATPTTPGQPSNTPAALDDAYRQAIASLLNTPQTVTPESLQSDPATQAYNLGAQRSEERQRAQIAEQDAQDGTNQSGGMNTELAGLRQQRGQGEAAFVGNLAMQKMQDNRAALVQGIQAEQQRGEFDKAQALQVQLADLDAQIRREGLASSNSQASADLALRSQLGLSGLDLQRLALELSNTQANNQLGYNYTALQLGANQNAYTQLGF